MKRFSIFFTLIVCMATLSRFYRLSLPRVYYFDEVYHALTSKLIARNDPRAYEWWNEPVEPNTAVDWLHPPLAKYTQATSMKLFGENSFGWRFSSAVFGVLVILATALLAHIYFRNRTLTLLATLLVSLDGLLLSQSRIAMNDIHVTFFIITTCACYGIYRQRLEKKLPANLWLLITGITAGLSMGSKWSGIYVLIAVWITESIRLLQRRTHQKRKRFIHLFRMIVFLAVIPIVLYVGSYIHMFLQGKSLICTLDHVQQGQCYCSQESSFWAITPQLQALEARGGCKRLISHFSELQNQTWWYQTNLKATHPYQSKPWQWVLDIRPVWQYVDYSHYSQGIVANIYDVGNPLLFWTGIVCVIALTILFGLKKKTFCSWRIGFLLLTYFIVWAPWTFSPRIMFFYHYAPAVPILCVLTAYTLTLLWKRQRATHLAIGCLITGIALTYVFLFPLNTGLPMHQNYFDAIFTLFPSWK